MQECSLPGVKHETLKFEHHVFSTPALGVMAIEKYQDKS